MAGVFDHQSSKVNILFSKQASTWVRWGEVGPSTNSWTYKRSLNCTHQGWVSKTLQKIWWSQVAIYSLPEPNHKKTTYFYPSINHKRHTWPAETLSAWSLLWCLEPEAVIMQCSKPFNQISSIKYHLGPHLKLIDMSSNLFSEKVY